MSLQNVVEKVMAVSESLEAERRSSEVNRVNTFKNFSALYEQTQQLLANQATLTKKADSSLELAIELSEKMDLQNLQMDRQSAMIQQLMRTVEAQNNIIISLQSQSIHGV